MRNRAERVRIGPNGRQVVDVTVDGGYRPAVIRARASVPLRLVFRRLDVSECAERVVFSTPRLERRLALAGTTVVDLPAQPAGEVRFTCAMGRYVGRIELTDEPPSQLRRMRDDLGRFDRSLGAAHILWICLLPLIALLAAVMLDAAAALVVASAAMGAWIAGCVWAFGRHEWTLRRP